MPILARHRWLYPIDWRELSLLIRFRRAGGRCERCGRPHGCVMLHLGDGRWWDEDARAWRCGAGKRHRRLSPPHSVILPMRRTRVVLSACHLDHDREGTTSSSDGQFFRSGKRGDVAGEVNARYGVDPGFSFYTHVSDQHEVTT